MCCGRLVLGYVFRHDCRGYGPGWDVMVLEYLVWEKRNGRCFRHEWRRYEPVWVGSDECIFVLGDLGTGVSSETIIGATNRCWISKREFRRDDDALIKR